jgi:hypothetical protein
MRPSVPRTTKYRPSGVTGCFTIRYADFRCGLAAAFFAAASFAGFLPAIGISISF